MRDLVRFVYDYRLLVGRRDLLGVRLADNDLGRLAVLERVLGNPNHGPLDRRRHQRTQVRLPATYRTGGAEHRTVIVCLSAGGLVLNPAVGLSRGDRTVVRIPGPDDNAVHFPAEVVWESNEGKNVGLAFIGLPVEVHERALAKAG